MRWHKEFLASELSAKVGELCHQARGQNYEISRAINRGGENHRPGK